MLFTDFWDKLQHRPARRLVTRLLPSPDAGPAIESGAGYFQLRLNEMFLRDERQLWREFAPATLFLCEFKYGSREQPVKLPFFVSNQLLEGLSDKADLEKTRVKLNDTRVLGPVPYVGTDVAVFAGLFRTVIRDNRKRLFNVFEKLFGAAQASALASSLQLAETLSDELLESLGMSDVECVLAERNVFATLRRPLAGGYLAMLHCDEAVLGGQPLSVVDNTLFVGPEASRKAFDLCDYCLISLETMQTRNDFTTLPFHRFWKEAQMKLLRNQVEEAKAALIECQAAVLASDDLTEDHKSRLLEFYQASFLKEQDRFTGAGRGVDGDRRGSKENTGAELDLLQLAELASTTSRDVKDSVRRIQELFETPDMLPALHPENTPADQLDCAWEEALGKQLAGPAVPVAPRKLGSMLATAILR